MEVVKMTLDEEIGERIVYVANGIAGVIAAPIVLPLITLCDYATRGEDESNKFMEVVCEDAKMYLVYNMAMFYNAFFRWGSPKVE